MVKVTTKSLSEALARKHSMPGSHGANREPPRKVRSTSASPASAISTTLKWGGLMRERFITLNVPVPWATSSAATTQTATTCPSAAAPGGATVRTRNCVARTSNTTCAAAYRRMAFTKDPDRASSAKYSGMSGKKYGAGENRHPAHLPPSSKRSWYSAGR